MPTINYAERFERDIEQQFARELTSADMAQNQRYNFIDAQTIRIPTLELSGYKDHIRDGSKNRGKVGNTYTAYSLKHDRNIEFYVDEMDVDETNQVLSAANITGTFNSEQAIPEIDSYRYSKLYNEFTSNGGKANTEILTEKNILSVYDKMMEEMDEAAVPLEGRKLKVTPAIYTMLKNAEKIDRIIDVSKGAASINRNVRSLDEVDIDRIPSGRMKTIYDFSDGCVPGAGAKQINMILYHPSAIIAPTKVMDVYLWLKGTTPESSYGDLYQNRMFMDLFVIKQKIAGIQMNVEAGE